MSGLAQRAHRLAWLQLALPPRWGGNTPPLGHTPLHTLCLNHHTPSLPQRKAPLYPLDSLLDMTPHSPQPQERKLQDAAIPWEKKQKKVKHCSLFIYEPLSSWSSMVCSCWGVEGGEEEGEALASAHCFLVSCVATTGCSCLRSDCLSLTLPEGSARSTPVTTDLAGGAQNTGGSPKAAETGRWEESTAWSGPSCGPPTKPQLGKGGRRRLKEGGPVGRSDCTMSPFHQ